MCFMILFNFVVFFFKELCPENFIHFKNKIVIKKMDARKYEESLKAELTNWIKNGNAEEVIAIHILSEIPSPLFFLGYLVQSSLLSGFFNFNFNFRIIN